MKKIPLTQGYETIVDDITYPVLRSLRLAAHNVTKKGATPKVYAYFSRQENGKQIRLYLHNYVWILANGPIPPGLEVDHIIHGDHGGLDNRLENLRLATRSENIWNGRKMPLRLGKPLLSKWKGVTHNLANGSWDAYGSIRVNGKSIKKHIGCFDSELEAAAAYDRFCIAYRDPKRCKLNFPLENYAGEKLPPRFDMQARKRRATKDYASRSPYVGVVYHNTWSLEIRINRELKKVCGFRTEMEAAESYDKMVILLRPLAELKVNFPDRVLDYMQEIGSELGQKAEIATPLATDVPHQHISRKYAVMLSRSR